MNKPKRFVQELADATLELLTSKCDDPSAEEIARQHYGRKTVGDAAVEEVRRFLPKIAGLLETRHGQAIYLVNQAYYENFRIARPANHVEAGRCLPGGRGMRAAGLKLNKSEEDLIFLVRADRDLRSGAGKMHASSNRLIKAVKDRRLSKPVAAGLLSTAAQLANPTNAKLAATILKALPPAASDK